METSYNDATIRQLLQVVFDDEQFSLFCFDHFPPVYKHFTSGMGRLVKIQLLIDHSGSCDEFDILLAKIKEISPVQYDKFEPLMKTPKRRNNNPIPLLEKFLKTPEAEVSSVRSRVEITLPGDLSHFSQEKREVAIEAAVGALAGALGIPRNQIEVLCVRYGSIILQLEMPTEAANRLIALLDEANDPIMQDLGIQRVRRISGRPATTAISSRVHGKSQRAQINTIVGVLTLIGPSVQLVRSIRNKLSQAGLSYDMQTNKNQLKQTLIDKMQNDPEFVDILSGLFDDIQNALIDCLLDRFTNRDLREVYARLGIGFEDLVAGTLAGKFDKINALIEHLKVEDDGIVKLIAVMQKVRPKIDC